MVRKLQITFSQAVDGFLMEKRAGRLSPHTLLDYGNAFRKLADYLDGDPPIEGISEHDLVAFLAELGERMITPRGIAPREARRLSKKSLLNIHTGLSSLWSWALREGYVDRHVLRLVPRPRPEQRVIVPYSREDVQGMLAACNVTRMYDRPGKRPCQNTRSTGLRDVAIIHLLLDTGLRASELCELQVKNLNMEAQWLHVFGKGSKERLVHFGRGTSKAIWRYLASRSDKRQDDPLFVSYGQIGAGLTRTGLRILMGRLGAKANVTPAANCHRFRHTFAINFLRNGGDVYALQMMLGHSTLDMVKHYLSMAQVDVANAHRRASPIDNWRL
jgi:site-specific recombinase XerD